MKTATKEVAIWDETVAPSVAYHRRKAKSGSGGAVPEADVEVAHALIQMSKDGGALGTVHGMRVPLSQDRFARLHVPRQKRKAWKNYVSSTRPFQRYIPVPRATEDERPPILKVYTRKRVRVRQVMPTVVKREPSPPVVNHTNVVSNANPGVVIDLTDDDNDVTVAVAGSSSVFPHATVVPVWPALLPPQFFAQQGWYHPGQDVVNGRGMFRSRFGGKSEATATGFYPAIGGVPRVSTPVPTMGVPRISIPIPRNGPRVVPNPTPSASSGGAVTTTPQMAADMYYSHLVNNAVNRFLERRLKEKESRK